VGDGRCEDEKEEGFFKGSREEDEEEFFGRSRGHIGRDNIVDVDS
jgi:hypothetical protein